jgi:Undecaprenyl-phosphate glucose phosphotransferase
VKPAPGAGSAAASAGSMFAADRRRFVVGLLRLADPAIVVSAGFAAYWIRHGTLLLPDLYLVAVVIAALLTTNYMSLARVYGFAGLRQVVMQIGTAAASWAAVGLTLLTLAYLTKLSDSFSRFWAISWFVSSLGGFGVVRLAVAFGLRRWAGDGMLATNLAVIGCGRAAARLIEHVRHSDPEGVRVLGVFADDDETPGPTVAGAPVLGGLDAIADFARDHRIDEIVIALPGDDEARIIEALGRVRNVAADIRLCPEPAAFEIPNMGYGITAGVPMLKVIERPLPGWNGLAKAIEDRLLAAALLALFAPLLAVIALAIRIEGGGPVLFRQRRYGFNNNEFHVWKFRTMAPSAAGDGEIVQARRDDPRVTRIGTVLRRTSLDELPQLFNVLRGEMSLVGPRPHAVAHNVKYAAMIDQYLGRHRVKPGITGWAQINGLRGEITAPEEMRRRVLLDLHYIEHWSLLFDLKILFLTLFVGFVHRKAY